MSMSSIAASIAGSIAAHLTHHRQTHTRPLFVALQAPQGFGKSFASAELPALLAPSTRLVSLSLDDFYLPHAAQRALAAAHPTSTLLSGRGLPGTHDLPLLTHTLASLRSLPTSAAPTPLTPPPFVDLPQYDKSLHTGQGDRLPTTRRVPAPVDVVLLEGWCVGFGALPAPTLTSRLDAHISGTTPISGLAEVHLDARTWDRADIALSNELLRAYAPAWDFFDVCIQLTTPPDSPFRPIYTRRLQAERAMKAQNGGRGMSDDEVVSFINRYIPAYVFFADDIGRRWKGRGLRLTLAPPRTGPDVHPDDRQLLTVESF